MPAHPDDTEGLGETWIRDGELYTPDMEKLIAETGALSVFVWEGEVYAFLPKRGKVALHELLKTKLEPVR